MIFTLSDVLGIACSEVPVGSGIAYFPMVSLPRGEKCRMLFGVSESRWVNFLLSLQPPCPPSLFRSFCGVAPRPALAVLGKLLDTKKISTDDTGAQDHGAQILCWVVHKPSRAIGRLHVTMAIRGPS